MSSGFGSAQSTRPFRLESSYGPAGDQQTVIDMISDSLAAGVREQTILGVTGSGKTYMMAAIVEKLQKPTLVIAHNKTLAAQLAEEFKRFFPDNAVHYFVSYYDYYQPESYIPRSDTFIEKQTQINEEIERLRNASTQALLTRRDVLIVASVSCIYGIGSPEDAELLKIELKTGNEYKIDRLARRLVDLQFLRTHLDLQRGMFRIRGDTLELVPSSEDTGYRFNFYGTELESIETFDLITNNTLETGISTYYVYPARQYVTTQEKIERAIGAIQSDLAARTAWFEQQGLYLPAERLRQRTSNDIEMLQTLGFCAGIENYSVYFDGRSDGEPPATLLDYFPSDSITFIDESHITLPQIAAMYNGDRSRKETLIEYGFRLPSALNNRPLRIHEFFNAVNQIVYVSATPGDFELGKSNRVGKSTTSALPHREAKHVSIPIAEAIIRPTGLLDPVIVVKPVANQVDDVLEQVRRRISNGQRVLITTLTKKFAEDLDMYFRQINIKSAYIHSDIETLDRLDILSDLRRGRYDVLIGINLLREGLDLPEVSLVAIFDADKEGFLRSKTSLIQIIGRAARHTDGTVVMYADTVTRSMREAIDETMRRRELQLAYNQRHGIIPRNASRGLKSIADDVRDEVSKNQQFGKAGVTYSPLGWQDQIEYEIENRYARGGTRSGRQRRSQSVRNDKVVHEQRHSMHVYDSFDEVKGNILSELQQKNYSYSELKERLQIAIDAMNFPEAAAISEYLAQLRNQ